MQHQLLISMKYSTLLCLSSWLLFVSLPARTEVTGFTLTETIGKSNPNASYHENSEIYQVALVFNIDTIKPKKKKVFEGILEGGYSQGTGDFDYSNYKTSFTAAYHKNARISLGAGVGFTHYSWAFYDKQFLPALSWHVDFRFYPFIEKFNPFVFLRLGVSRNTYDLDEVGYMGSGGVGYRQKLRGRSSLLVRLTYDTHSFVKKRRYWGDPDNSKTLKFAESIGLTFGWIF